MNVSDPGASRPNFYDRNPLNASVSFYQHALTTQVSTVQWTYTVPANRKAQVLGVTALVAETGASTGGARMDAFVNATPSGGTVATLVRALITSVASLATPNVCSATVAGPLLLAGDVITGSSRNEDATGAGDFGIGASIIEFDA